MEVLPVGRELETVREWSSKVQGLGCAAGLVINPPTELHDEHLALFEVADFALIMSVNPGFGGQAFIESVLEKARRLRGALPMSKRIEIRWRN